MWEKSPIKTTWAAFLCFWVSLGPGAFGHEDGAPSSVCATMFPGHGIPAQETDSPYTLGATKISGQPGDDTVSVTITSAQAFQGFFLQARDGNDQNSILDGMFSVPPNCRRQSCPPYKDNTLTQANKSPKVNLTTVWTPPSGFDGQVFFRATVAEAFHKFWTDLQTVPISVVASVRTSTTPETTTTSSLLSSTPNVNYNDYSVCGKSRGCFGYPQSCVENKNCEILLMYSSNDDGVVFELIGAIKENTEQWIAIGLSFDTRMGDDSVTECMNPASGGVIVQQSWNVSPPDRYNVVLENPKQGISEIQGSVSDGTVYCKWKRQFVTNIKNHKYDIEKDKFYLFLARGPVRDGAKRKHKVHLISASEVQLTTTDVVSGKSDYLVKIHGVFMITAWISFVSVGILLARHYKNVWENETLCTLKVWFACHRTLMLGSVGLIIAAFICIFVYVDGWSAAQNPHPVLGCVCTSLAVLQPIMALARPAPNAPKRYIFNWLHWLVGNSGQVLAVATMFYAVELTTARLSIGFYYVLIAFVIFHFLFHIVMQVHTYTMEKKVHNVMQLHDMNHKGTTEVPKDAPGSSFRRWMLAIYVVINTGFTATLVLLVIL